MLKFSQLVEVSKEFLSNSLNESVTVDEGKYGEMPSLAPCVWIYAEPVRNAVTVANNVPAIRRAKLTFFAIEGAALNKTEAVNKSVELIELVEEKIFSSQFTQFINDHQKNINQLNTTIRYTDSEQPLNFDAIYADFAVSFLEVWIDYTI